MYRLIRTDRGVTETLKDSNSHLDKTFSDSVAAELLAKKLNAYNLNKNIIWIVEQI